MNGRERELLFESQQKSIRWCEQTNHIIDFAINKLNAAIVAREYLIKSMPRATKHETWFVNKQSATIAINNFVSQRKRKTRQTSKIRICYTVWRSGTYECKLGCVLHFFFFSSNFIYASKTSFSKSDKNFASHRRAIVWTAQQSECKKKIGVGSFRIFISLRIVSAFVRAMTRAFNFSLTYRCSNGNTAHIWMYIYIIHNWNEAPTRTFDVEYKQKQ